MSFHTEFPWWAQFTGQGFNEKKTRPGMMIHTYNPSYSGVKDMEDHDSRPAWRKKWDSISINTKGVVIHISNPTYVGGISRNFVFWGWPGHKAQDPIWKITETKLGWGITEVVEQLHSKHGALSSNPSAEKTSNTRENSPILVRSKRQDKPYP
jgi:hypothetical protein